MDIAYLEPSVKQWKHWKWNYNKLTGQEYQRLKKIQDRKRAMYEEWDRLPDWFNPENAKLMNVIFIRDMDEFLAGEVAEIETGLYRNHLQPHKIAVPASEENIARWKHLNAAQRGERDRKRKMETLSDDISQVRLEMKIRRDPETQAVYTYITKRKICRKLLLFKRITVYPEQVQITRLAESILTRGVDGDGEAGSLDMIKEEGSYIISLNLDASYDYKFEFRLNVRYNEVERENKTPFALGEDERDSDVEEEEETVSVDGKKTKKKGENKELRTALKKWRRRKQANLMLDHLVDEKSRYSALYAVSKLDLTLNQTMIDESDVNRQQTVS
mmetsp:Transcript_9406/g.15144  ORF Transcript_9406/g.15144 Transcript_9406/m.15144 type:complete len:330 (-) Transcript_9406:73-1062(-)